MASKKLVEPTHYFFPPDIKAVRTMHAVKFTPREYLAELRVFGRRIYAFLFISPGLLFKKVQLLLNVVEKSAAFLRIRLLELLEIFLEPFVAERAFPRLAVNRDAVRNEILNRFGLLRVLPYLCDFCIQILELAQVLLSGDAAGLS